MQICIFPFPSNFDFVATHLLGFDVKKLSDITNEMNQELQRLLSLLCGQFLLLNTLGVITDGRDDAAVWTTVTSDDDRAR